MAKLTPFPTGQELDANGNPLSGGKVYTYEAGTTTDKVTYTDASEAVANANPVILDSEGRGEIWLGEGSYNIRLFDSSDNLIDERDDVIGDSSASFLGSVSTLSGNMTITSAFQNALISVTAAATLSLLSAADAGAGFSFAVRNDSSDQVTIDPDLSETPITILSPNQWVIYVSDGTNWKILDKNEPKSNLSASVAPAVGDDSDDGYSVGSLWVDTTADETYRCLDSTVGAAVWVKTTLSSDELGGLAFLDVLDEDDFSSDSATRPPSQQSAAQFISAQSRDYLLAEVTASNSANVEFTSNIDATYDAYLIVGIDVVPATDDVGLLAEVSSNGGTSYKTTGYDYNLRVNDELGTDDNTQGNTEFSIAGNNAGQNIGNASNEGVSFELTMYSPSSSLAHKFRSEAIYLGTDTTPHNGVMYGVHTDAAAIDAIRFRMTSGNITSGRFLLYGLYKA